VKKRRRTDCSPTAKVIGDSIFVAKCGPTAAGADPDPIDFDGHGTHVSDIHWRQFRRGTRREVSRVQSLQLCLHGL